MTLYLNFSSKVLKFWSKSATVFVIILYKYLEYWKLAIFSIEAQQSNFVSTRRQLADIDFSTDFDYQQFGDISRLISFSAWSSESDNIEIDQLNIIDDELKRNQYGDSNNNFCRFHQHIIINLNILLILQRIQMLYLKYQTYTFNEMWKCESKLATKSQDLLQTHWLLL